MSDKSQGFNEAYETLKRNAEKLRTQQDLDIDGLVPIVQQSAQAYEVCKERIAAVRASIEQHLKSTPEEPS